MKYTYRFDRDYYERYFGRRRPRKTDEIEARLLGDFICGYLRYLRQPVRSVLDVGCGLGLWRDVIARHFPRAHYEGLEVSEYLCRRYGWMPGSIVSCNVRRSFDFVICKDVVQYLTAAEASAAIGNLARLSRGALYFSTLTKEDWERNCDRDRTNADVYKRSVRWYRDRLERRFVNVGGGLFVRDTAPVVLWELEKLR